MQQKVLEILHPSGTTAVVLLHAHSTQLSLALRGHSARCHQPGRRAENAMVEH